MAISLQPWLPYSSNCYWHVVIMVAGGCLDDMQGSIELVEAALGFLASPAAAGSRVAFLHNPKNPEQAPGTIALALQAAVQLPSRRAKIAGYLVALLAAGRPSGEKPKGACTQDSAACLDHAGWSNYFLNGVSVP